MPRGHHLLQILGNIGSIMLNSTFISSYVWSKKSIIHTEYKFLLVQKIYYIYFFSKYFNCKSAVNWMNKQGKTLKCIFLSQTAFTVWIALLVLNLWILFCVNARGETGNTRLWCHCLCCLSPPFENRIESQHTMFFSLLVKFQHSGTTFPSWSTKQT